MLPGELIELVEALELQIEVLNGIIAKQEKIIYDLRQDAILNAQYMKTYTNSLNPR